jgi:hypothetical protein
MAYDRCDARLYYELRSDLPYGHRSPHVTKRDGTLIHWRVGWPPPRSADPNDDGDGADTAAS